MRDAVESALEVADPAALILVDQNDDDRITTSLGQLSSHPRLRHIRSDTVGAGRARNIGSQHATGEVVCFTDDDCILPPDFARRMTEIVLSDDRIGMVFAAVTDWDLGEPGYTPIHRVGEFRRSTGWDLSARHGRLGIGAGMACRRSALSDVGGFDPMMGPGGTFPSADDRELAIRMLLKGWHVVHTPDVTVVHLGFRCAGKQARSLTRRDYIALGAMYAKFLKLSPARGLFHMLVFLTDTTWAVITESMKQRRPASLTKVQGALHGIWKGLRTPTDRESMCYTDGVADGASDHFGH